MSTQAAAMQLAKTSVPVGKSATDDVFNRIQQTLYETEEENKQGKIVHPEPCSNETR